MITAMLFNDINFDGLVGPSHNFAGLSAGNVASIEHKGSRSSPRAAALQGLGKAKALADRGLLQAVLPPAPRPDLNALAGWGVPGDTAEEILRNAAGFPELLAAAYSASSMWTANACTMTPSCDTTDKRVHFTPANLYSKLHRSIEAPFTTRMLKMIFSDENHFHVHTPLSGGDAMADEGAANHTRLCSANGSNALHVFVFGRSALEAGLPAPAKFPARQTRESFQSIARRHKIPPRRTLFVQQSPEAIDAGVFHNDVISVGDHNVFLYHEAAFVHTRQVIHILQERFKAVTGDNLVPVQVMQDAVSISEAVATYLFNSQLIKKTDGTHLLVVPGECVENKKVNKLLNDLVEDAANPITEFIQFDLRQSMKNGGGPACLRNRITLNTVEQDRIRGRLFLDDTLYDDLCDWINRHYRESLEPADLTDPSLIRECRDALDELGRILQLPDLYDFKP